MLDTSKIEGYAEMSAEDKVKALEALEFDDNSAELERYKNATSKANSEAAEYKRKLKALEEQKAEGLSESEKKMAELEEQIKSLNREKAVTVRKAKFLSHGFDEASADKAAEAFTNGDSDGFFEVLGSFLTEHDKTFKADLLKSTPRPEGEGGKAPTMTKEAFRKLSPAERRQYSIDHPDEYNKIYGG